MQLRPTTSPRSIRQKLARATTALLTLSGSPAPAEPPKLSGSIGYLYYSEQDRVTAHEPALELIADFGGERKWVNKILVDTLTGPSHNGGVPSRFQQTIATPSGHGDFRTAPGKVPLDPSFRDTRISYTTSWSQPLGNNYEYAVSGNYSSEYDFKSAAANTTWSRFFDRKNTKLTLGLAYEQDTITPVGKAPIGLTAMTPKQTGAGQKSKTIWDILLGWTQVVSRKFIFQTNYSLGLGDGYHTDPYKILTEVEPAADPNAGDPTGTYIYEKRPDQRTKNSLYFSGKYHVLKNSVIGTSYRYFWDDWGLRSHTVGLEFHVPLTNSWKLSPDFRYYRQQKADFHRYFLIEGDSLPQFASADYRLGNMDAYTVGLKGTKRLNEKGNEIGIHLQYYEQRPEGKPGEAFGSLKAFNLAPEIKSVIVRVIYSF